MRVTAGPKLADFRARARAEADRYGPDPWVFVRELLQNARDAGATQVEFVAEVVGGLWVLRCRDDGEGMTFAHARRYLFSLYASSKEQRRDQVGRFGVGFWSILRFEPERIVIRSQPRSARPEAQDPEDRPGAWEIELAGDLESARRGAPAMQPGTEVVLERPAIDGELERRVYEAAVQNARFLCTRDDPERPLRVTVGGKRVNVPFALPAPSASFRRGRVRGVVGLGTAARVELFSRGLRVRSAASLADFVVAGGKSSDRSRVQFAELPGRLAPQALLESDALELMLSRSDARDNKALRRLVQLAQRELEGLIARQLDAARPLPWWQRPWAAVRDGLRRSLALRMVLAAVLGAGLAAAGAHALWGGRVWSRLGQGLSGEPVWTGASGQEHTASAELPARYADLAGRYGGPQVDVLTGVGVREPPLTYAPPELRLHFAALIFERLSEADKARAPVPVGPYAFETCHDGQVCPRVELRLDAPAGSLRVPVPTGQGVVAGSAELDGRPAELAAGAHGEAVLTLSGGSKGVLRYRTVAAAATERGRAEPSGLLSPELAREAAGLRGRPLAERVQALTRRTRALVRYSIDPEVALEHRRARDKSFIARAVEIGRGDCDVQNGLLAALLQEAGVPARLAIGFVGQEGRVRPWLHAWAEYLDEDGSWAVADASVEFVRGPSDMAEGSGGDPDELVGEPRGPALPDPPVAAPPRASAPGEPWTRRALSYLLAASTAALGLSLLLLLRGRTRRELVLDASGDLSRLLQGALQQPEVFQAVPAVFERPLVPTAGKRALSLMQAKALAGRGQLFRTRQRSALALDALAGGAVVLDDSVEARAVADALGAIDLDLWDMLLASATETELLGAASARLCESGEPWRILTSPALGSEEIRSIDLAPLHLRRSPLRGRRVVLVGEKNPWLLDAAGAFAGRPDAAVFAALDYVIDRLDLGAERAAFLLESSARAAVHEAARGERA